MTTQAEKKVSDLCAIQCELKAPKSKWNKFSSFFYRSTEDILEALKPLLAKYGCELTISDECSDIAGIPVVKACVVFVDSHGKSYTSTSYAGIEHKKGMDMSQVFGSASTYARKYALNGMFLIDDTKDADSDEYQQNNGQQQNNRQQQNNGQQQNNRQQQNNQQSLPSNQGKSKKDIPLEVRFQNALFQIKNTEDPNFLNVCVEAFARNQYANDISRACQARADQMGWTKGN